MHEAGHEVLMSIHEHFDDLSADSHAVRSSSTSLEDDFLVIPWAPKSLAEPTRAKEAFPTAGLRHSSIVEDQSCFAPLPPDSLSQLAVYSALRPMHYPVTCRFEQGGQYSIFCDPSVNELRPGDPIPRLY